MEKVCFVRLNEYVEMLGTFGQSSIWSTRNGRFFGQFANVISAFTKKISFWLMCNDFYYTSTKCIFLNLKNVFFFWSRHNLVNWDATKIIIS